MEFIVHHSTAGSNSYQIIKDGRPGYGTSLAQALFPKSGPPFQFAEINSKCFHAGSAEYGDYNGYGPGFEVERLGPGQNDLTEWEDLTEDQAHWVGEANRWLESEWGIPNIQYRGPRFSPWQADFNGHVSHWDLHPNDDGLSFDEWDRVTKVKKPEEPKPYFYVEEMGMIWENVDVPLPKDGNTVSKRFMKRVGTGLVPCSQVEVYVDATHGVPYFAGGNTFTILRQVQICAQAQKSAQSILTGPVQ
jgi:hypothetical protein